MMAAAATLFNSGLAAAKRLPMWVWFVFALVMTGKYIQITSRKQGYEEGQEEVLDQVEEQTSERIEAVEEVRRTTADLNELERLRLAGQSKNNRGRVQLPENP
jgi:hypothetical protein